MPGSWSASRLAAAGTPPGPEVRPTWLRTNGVDTNGAAAKVMNFDRLQKKVRPASTFGEIKVGKREYPKGPSVDKKQMQ